MTPSPPPVDETDTPVPASQDPALPEFSYELKVPKDRIAVLIGPQGKVKQELEEQTKTSIKVDSKEGDVSLQGKDSLALFALREVVKAIGRGFNPEIATLLLKQDYVIEIVNCNDYAQQKSHVQRLRGRVIGADGKARTTIEHVTETSIVVYGKTISIIGTTERAMLARRAVELLLEGSTHAAVYKWLEKNIKQFRKKEGLSF
ncbi:RNA-processing protein [Candidatus Woesearchaeota archaeon]|nr:RNA-processing protein [Candidatus Woesearchaeota archaeon]